MSKQRQKGTSFETAVVNYLHGHGVSAGRLPLAGNKDEGDIRAWTEKAGFWHFEAKNCRTITLAAWVAEADAEAANAECPVAVVAKRVGKGDPGEAYVVMPLRVFVSSVLGYDGTRGHSEETQ
jgi:endogenous inhibitor of DNA gyrase (YacG/DUF329 family)